MTSIDTALVVVNLEHSYLSVSIVDIEHVFIYWARYWGRFCRRYFAKVFFKRKLSPKNFGSRTVFKI